MLGPALAAGTQVLTSPMQSLPPTVRDQQRENTNTMTAQGGQQEGMGPRGTILREATLQPEGQMPRRVIKDWEVCFKKREQHRQRTGGENELSALGEPQRILGRRERRGEDGEGVRGCITKGLGGNTEAKILVMVLGGTEVFGAGREYPRVHSLKNDIQVLGLPKETVPFSLPCLSK